MSEHYIVKCKICGNTIRQCRCIDNNKPVIFETCDGCKTLDKKSVSEQGREGQSEFTKKIRNFCGMYKNEIPRRAEITFLLDACDIIDSLEAENKELKAADRDHLSAYNGLKTRFEQQSELIRKYESYKVFFDRLIQLPEIEQALKEVK